MITFFDFRIFTLWQVFHGSTKHLPYFFGALPLPHYCHFIFTAALFSIHVWFSSLGFFFI